MNSFFIFFLRSIIHHLPFKIMHTQKLRLSPSHKYHYGTYYSNFQLLHSRIICRDLDWRSYSNDFIHTMVSQFLNDNLAFRLSFILFGWVSWWAFCFVHCRSSPCPRHVSQELHFPRFLYRIISHIRFLNFRKFKKKQAVVIDWQCDWFMNDNLEIWITSASNSSSSI